MPQSHSCAAYAILMMIAATGTVSASELVYRPINPSFGGNPLNSSHLLSLAEIQNQFREEPASVLGSTGLSQSELFVRQLQSRLLSGLAGQVTDAIFGEKAQDSGEIVFGEQTISFQRGLESINIAIFDATTGSTTEVRVPLLQTGTTSGLGP
jgi:curli production assembly/transport component CsgF